MRNDSTRLIPQDHSQDFSQIVAAMIMHILQAGVYAFATLAIFGVAYYCRRPITRCVTNINRLFETCQTQDNEFLYQNLAAPITNAA